MADEQPTFGRGQEDFKLADWLSLELEGRWRFDHTAERWHHWNGHRWAPDDTDKVLYAVADRARRALASGKWSTGGPTLGTDGVKSMLSLLKVPSALRALTALASFPDYATNGDDWDSIPYLLGVENGVVDLRTNTLIENPSPGCLVTKTTKVKFSPVARPDEFADRAPKFMEVMGQWMSEDVPMVSFLLLWFGSSLFGFSPEQRFLLMVGIGRNGKGALKHSIMRAVGEYGSQFDANLYMRSKWGAARSDQARADLIAIKGKRITFFSEPEGNKFNEELLKAHTGGDRITARALHSNNVQSWDPTHSITFLVNNAPEIDDIGPSMAARVMVADFRERFDGEREDKQLYGSLEKEAEGILAILCWAAARWYESWSTGQGGITLPERVVEQSRRFMERSDPISRWLEERTEYAPDTRTAGQLAYDNYLDWHRTAGESGDSMSLVKFTSAVEHKGFRRYRSPSSRGFEGFKLLGAVALAERGDDGDEGDE